jgi:hypothetical protein
MCLVLQLSNMEVTKQQAAVFAALKSGNEALKQAQAEVGAVSLRYKGCANFALMWEQQWITGRSSNLHSALALM